LECGLSVAFLKDTIFALKEGANGCCRASAFCNRALELEGVRARFAVSALVTKPASRSQLEAEDFFWMERFG
jgi:hypothetical protein